MRPVIMAIDPEQAVEVRLEKIKSRLLERPGKLIPKGTAPVNLPKAAVSLILRPSVGDQEIYLLLVKRRTLAADPWSGHMALPGGRHVERDSDLLATAIREVLEETGIDLRSASILGSLDEILPGNASIRVLPYVALLRGDVKITLNKSEIQDWYWIPLSFFEDPNNLLPYSPELRGKRVEVTAFTYKGTGKIWGMTLRIIQDFVAKISRD
jgi:8-oxo-dGTP pyrophosphatase MutT (NUDIX family)